MSIPLVLTKFSSPVRMVLRKVDDFEGALTVDVTFRFGWRDDRMIVPPEVSDTPLLPIVDQDILDNIWMPRLVHSNLKAIENVYFTKYQTGWDHGEIYLLKTKRKSFKS